MQGILSQTWRMAEKTDQDRHPCQWDEYVQTAQVKNLEGEKKDHCKRKSIIFQGRRRRGQGMDWMVYREPPKNLLENLLGIKELWVILSHPRNMFSPRKPLFVYLRDNNHPEFALCPLQPYSSVVTWASHGRVHPCGAMVKVILGKP